MNRYFVVAAALVLVVGLVHSVLGEMLIFRRQRQDGLVPTNGGKVLGEGHVRILWATWHVVTVFAWCFAAVLIHLSFPSASGTSNGFVVQAIALAMLAGSALVLIGTQARHPGWVGLLGVAVLVWLGQDG